MTVYNNSSKIIGIQELSILPGETKPLPAGAEKNPIVLKYIADGTFTEVKAAKKSSGTKDPGTKDPDAKAGDGVQNPDGSQNPNGAQNADGAKDPAVDSKKVGK